jgi:cyclophilin family peptidyl-prolyl cis-trans isomerase
MSWRRFLVVGLLLTVVAAAPMLQGGSKKGTQYAILVAISKYGKTDQWRPLPYTIDEMREFREVLLTSGFAKENIEFLHDQQADEKLRPTGANLLKKIKLMLNEIGPDDTLLVALNGHGVQYKGDATGYFCPVNADLLDKKTLVAMDGKDGIYGLLETCKAQRKLLIVNACRNDPTRDLSFAAEKVQLVDRDESEVPKGIAALFSCKPGQKSYYYPEEQKIKRSIFYHHLIEAWRGKYAEGEKITLDHVFDVVARKTAADARTVFSESQTPWPRRKYEGEWTLRVAPIRTDSPVVEKALRVVMDTSHGKITIELFAEKAPITVKNFLRYVEEKHYDGTTVHRVIADFMIQGGGFEPDFKERKTRDPIKNESNNGLSNHRGTITMSRTGDPDSAAAQFFINTADNKFLDRKDGASPGYAVFGQVIDGMDVVDKIRRVQTGNRGGHPDTPLEDVIIRSVRPTKK